MRIKVSHKLGKRKQCALQQCEAWWSLQQTKVQLVSGLRDMSASEYVMVKMLWLAAHAFENEHSSTQSHMHMYLTGVYVPMACHKKALPSLRSSWHSFPLLMSSASVEWMEQRRHNYKEKKGMSERV